MTNVLFNIQLKVGSNILALNVKEDDTIKTLVDGLCKNGCKQPKDIVEAKIIDSLTKIKNTSSTEIPLKMKISKFIKRNANEPLRQNKTHFNSKSQQKKYIQNQQNNHVVKTKVIKECNTKIRFSTIHQQEVSGFTTCNPETQYNPFSTDEQDLVQAYTLILAKSNNTQIKELVSQTLSQLQMKTLRKQRLRLKRILVEQRSEHKSIQSLRNKYLYPTARRNGHITSIQGKNRQKDGVTERVGIRQRVQTEVVENNLGEFVADDYQKVRNMNTNNGYVSDDPLGDQREQIQEIRSYLVKDKSYSVCAKKYNYLQFQE